MTIWFNINFVEIPEFTASVLIAERDSALAVDFLKKFIGYELYAFEPDITEEMRKVTIGGINASYADGIRYAMDCADGTQYDDSTIKISKDFCRILFAISDDDKIKKIMDDYFGWAIFGHSPRWYGGVKDWMDITDIALVCELRNAMDRVKNYEKWQKTVRSCQGREKNKNRTA